MDHLKQSSLFHLLLDHVTGFLCIYILQPCFTLKHVVKRKRNMCAATFLFMLKKTLLVILPTDVAF